MHVGISDLTPIKQLAHRCILASHSINQRNYGFKDITFLNNTTHITKCVSYQFVTSDSRIITAKFVSLFSVYLESLCSLEIVDF